MRSLARAALRRLSSRVTHATWLSVLALLPALALGPRSLAAQEAPIVTISPPSQMLYSDSVFVTITWCATWGSEAYDPDTREIKLSGVNILHRFTHDTDGWGSRPECMQYERSTGWVLTTQSTQTLSALVYNYVNWLGAESVVYTRPAPTGAVQVTAAASLLEREPGPGGVASFTVKNAGSASDVINLVATCTGQVSLCQLSDASVSLGTTKFDNTAVVTVSFTTGSAVGQTGRIQVKGTSQNVPSVSDSAFTDVLVLAPPPPPPPPYGDPAVQIMNAGGNVERALCVAVGAGAGAAYECGDLRVAHALPEVTTFGSVKAPTLIYNSQHARPRPVIRANVTVPGGNDLPTTVTATVTIGGVQYGAGSWAGSDWAAPGTTRSVAIELDGSSLGTWRYDYTLTVTAHWPNSTTTASTVTGTLLNVNRSNSPYGAGWWLAGLERIVCYDGSCLTMLWFGGDGSVRAYERTSGAQSVWHAPRTLGPDSITVAGLTYSRWLAGGGRVMFNAYGLHFATENRLGQTTHFQQPSEGIITSISIPTNGGASLVYTLAYNNPGGKLSGIAAPSPLGGSATRNVAVAMNGAQLTSITDPDNHTVSFGYGTGADANVIVSRTDKRNYQTTFGYGAAGRFEHHTIAGLTSTYHFAAERRGLSGGPVPSAQPLDSVFVRIDGPRGDVQDVTTIRVNAYGAPTRVRNALGQETQITYDATWPGLAYQVVSPTGLTTRAFYSPTRGLLDSTVVYNPNGSFGAPGNAKTSYQWHASAPLLTQVSPPVGPSTSFGWDLATRNRLWEQVGTDQARRVNYGYNTAGLLESVTLPLHNAETFTYDGLGNLASQVSPAGHVTTFTRDAIGRATLVINPDSSRTRTHYDAMSRPDTTVTWGPARAVASTVPGDTLQTPADSVIVATTYDANGNARYTRRHFEIVAGYYDPSGTLHLSRHLRSPTTESEYDGANRVTLHRPDDVGAERSVYDPAGNVVQQITARNDTLFMQYDALNRLTQRVTRAKSYGSSWCRAYGMDNCEYYFPSIGTSVVIAPDTATFAYDAAGNMTQAFNSAARIWRHYTPAGQLATDTLQIRTYAMNDLCGGWCTSGGGAKIYGLRYVYDPGGRRTAMLAPANLRPPGAAHDSLRYVYSPATGALETVRDPFGQDVTLNYDAAGRNWQRVFPNGLTETRTYDAAGRTLTYQAPGAADDSYQYDAMGRITLATVGTVPITLAYTGLGAVLQTVNATSMYTNGAEQFLTDALGNRGWERNVGVRPAGHPDPDGIRLSDHDNVGRLTRRYWPGTHGYVDDKNYNYDAAGNRIVEWSYETYETGGGGNASDDADADAAANADADAAAAAAAAGEAETMFGGLGFGSLGFGSGLGLLAFDGDAFVRDDGRDALLGEPRPASARHFAPTTLGRWLAMDLGALVVTAPVVTHAVTALAAETGVRFDQTRHYYGADNKLRVLNRVIGPTGPAHAGSVYEEYRYDALGRRVLVRSRSLAGCGMTPCPKSYIERTVWDGDQVLVEIRAPGGNEISDYELENDNPSSSSGQSYAWGRVLYVHGPGIDAPLAVLRSGMSDYQPDVVTVFPHANWRGEYTNGSHPGSQTTNTQCAGYYGCPAISWPGAALTVDGAQAPGTSPPVAWVGSLLGRKTDGSGLQYLRNRYYDPATGKFTQVDPIGLAGGLNLYGFANGDAINFSDPFGLCGLPGAVASVAMGAALGAATGGYSLAAAGVDAGSGAVCAGVISKVAKVGKALGSSKKLRAALTTAGRIAQSGDEAHHIVAAGARGAGDARTLLDHLGVNINDAANGVFLPSGFHRQLHTTAYYQEVTSRVAQANSKEEVMEILGTIARELAERAKP